MSFMFDIPKETYIKSTLEQRLLWDLISERASRKFHNAVMEKIALKQPKDTFSYNWEINTQIQYREMEKRYESAIHCYMRLKFLYESEFGEMSEKLESEIEEVADDLAQHALVKFGWIKKVSLTLLDFQGKKKTFEVGNKTDVECIEIKILSGDEIAVVTYKDGTEKLFDSAPDRIMDFYDGEYVIYSEKEEIDVLETEAFLNRKSSYSYLYDTSEIEEGT